MQDAKFKIYHLTGALLKNLYKIVRSMPREYKYAIGKESIDCVWACMNFTLRAGYSSGREKTGLINRLSAEFDMLKIRLRLASEIGAIKEGQFAHLQENYLLEIGKMIGGWLKWSEKKTPAEINLNKQAL